MMAGYVNPQKSVIERQYVPGLKMVIFDEGKFRVVDMWQTSPFCKFSFGVTVIFFNNVPVWKMNYEGSYPSEEHISFLKMVLRRSYEIEAFNGGRGERNIRLDGFLYHNKCSGLFSCFQGIESITDDTEASRGSGQHTYYGGLIQYPEP